jgi:hypothetical protein
MPDDNTGVSYTLKGGTGFESPWIVLHGRDVEHANQMLAELADSVGMELLAETAKKFQGLNGGKGAWTKSAAAPASSSTPSAGPSTSQPAEAVARLQSELGAVQVNPETHVAASSGASEVPHDVMVCAMHNVSRRYFGPGVSTKTGKPFGASYRCPERGCAAKPPNPLSLWQREDGKWENKPWTGGR